jgi:hypothetical protein
MHQDDGTAFLRFFAAAAFGVKDSLYDDTAAYYLVSNQWYPESKGQFDTLIHQLLPGHFALFPHKEEHRKQFFPQ